MFTPPPSPDPRHAPHSSSADPSLKLDVAHSRHLTPSPASSRSSTPEPRLPPAHDQPLSPKEDPWTYAQLQKQRVGRRTKWTVVLLPLLLIFVGLSTRYLTHPAAFDVLSARSPDWSAVRDWSAHKRHAAPDPAPQTSPATTVENAKPTGTSLSLAPSASAAPTQVNSGDTKVPSTPPALPTPFPQPFDSTFSANFSTVGCQNFMTNMTQTAAFRRCRPFSLLVGDSNAFITSQRNISQLNIIMWGTCNTEPSAEQCAANMGWFAENIKTACQAEIAANNALVGDAVAGLEGYSLMRQAACQVNADTDTYCYIEAAQSTHPTDLYLYQLPLGLALPNTTVPSCTSCVQGLMGAFAQGVGNNSMLRKTYGPAASIVNEACGSAFVAVVDGVDENGALPALGRLGGAWAVGFGLLAGLLVL